MPTSRRTDCKSIYMQAEGEKNTEKSAQIFKNSIQRHEQQLQYKQYRTKKAKKHREKSPSFIPFPTDLCVNRNLLWVCRESLPEIYFIDAVTLLGFHRISRYVKKKVYSFALSNKLNKINGSEWKASITANILLNDSLSVFILYTTHTADVLCYRSIAAATAATAATHFGKWNKRALCLNTHIHKIYLHSHFVW